MRILIGRGMARSAGQVAVSVVATLIATQIYHGVSHRDVAVPAERTTSLTSGGKYDSRIAGAAMPPVAEPAKPALSIVNWAITPMHPSALIDDVAWGAEPQAAALPDPVARPVRREPRRLASAVSLPPAVPASRPPLLDLPTLPAAPLAAHAAADHASGLWVMLGSTAHSAVDLGGSVLALGGSTLGRLIPDRR